MAALVSDRTVADDTVRPRASRAAHLGILAAVFVTAYVARLLPVLRGGGLGFYGRYDDGVYYAAAESLSFGRVPYRDFVLLHPPGIALVLLPFTILGRLTTDPTGMTTARLVFLAVGALNAVLVTLVASRWGWTRGAAAGLLYALSAGAVYDEQATFIEPFGTLCTLVAVLALYRRTPRTAARREVLAGVALGLACCLKIWYAPILLAVVVVTALRDDLRAASRVLTAGAITIGLVLVPFFALAPGRMWTMVVTDQVDRSETPDRMGRVARMLGTDQVFAHHDPTLIGVTTTAIVVLLAIALVCCLGDRETWLIAALGIVAAAVLMASPSYFRHYGTFLSAPSALLLAVGLGMALRRLRPPSLRMVIGTVGVILVLASGIRVATTPTGGTFPAQAFAAVAPPGCIASDDPAALIQMNRLSQALRDHCDVPVDVTGSAYGAGVPRSDNPVFQRWLMHHLTSSAAFVVLRASGDPLSIAERRVLDHHRLLAAGDGVALRAGDRR